MRVLPWLAAGLRSAAGRPGLLAVIWLWHLALGAALALPVFAWLRAATAHQPAADVLAERWSFPVVGELLQYNQAPLLAMLQSGALGGLAVATATAPLLIALVLRGLGPEAAAGRDLGAAAVRLYWPFLRVLILGRALAFAGAAIVGAAAASAIGPLRTSFGEAGLWLGLALLAGGTLIVGAWLLGACDYALADLAREHGRSAIRAWMRGARCATAHPLATLALWSGSGVLLLLLLVVYTTIATSLPSAAPWFLPVAVLVQQLFMLGRTWVRAGLLAAEQGLLLAAYPAPVAPPPPAGAVDDAAFLPFDELGGAADSTASAP